MHSLVLPAKVLWPIKFLIEWLADCTLIVIASAWRKSIRSEVGVQQAIFDNSVRTSVSLNRSEGNQNGSITFDK